jgi:adenosine/AMP kinase
MELKMEPIDIPEGCNVIFGQSHFIKTVEDLYEILVSAVPGAKFGIGFCEASGHCLVRGEGNDEALRDLAMKTAYRIGAGHSFIVFIKEAFPINMLNAVKMCQEVCNVFCATANPVQVVLAQSEQGKGVLGVIDGSSPKGMEKEDGVAWRKDLLRKFGYKSRCRPLALPDFESRNSRLEFRGFDFSRGSREVKVSNFLDTV